MRLVYAYVGEFRNIRGQAFAFADDLVCSFEGDRLTVRHVAADAVRSAIFGESVLRDLTLVVGQTGAGKTNLFQLIGMDKYPREDLRRDGASYILLFEDKRSGKFVAEICNLFPENINLELNELDRNYGFLALYELTFDEAGDVASSRRLHRDFDPKTYIVNCFDRNAFAVPPCRDVHQETMYPDDYFPRVVSPYGRTNVGIACRQLQKVILECPVESIKRKACLRISAFNWSDDLHADLDEELEKEQYWTYREKRMERQRRRKPPVRQSPKFQFLHDLLTDYALYLRKWAENLPITENDEAALEMIERGLLDLKPEYVLPDFMHGAQAADHLRRIEWLGSYIDSHVDGEYMGSHGLVWQIADDIKDIYHLLNQFDDKYFTEDMFSLPIVDMDFESNPLRDLLERITGYRPDEYDIFTKELLPYVIEGVSSGEYQYAKTLGAIDEFCLKMKISVGGNRNFYRPDFILLLDEPEAYMHPELCRRFLSVTADVLHGHSRECDIQIIMTTHSPFMLSDVVSSQVIRLMQDELGYCRVLPRSERSTFADGIHSIMANEFFLDFTIGEYSRRLVTSLLDDLTLIRSSRSEVKDADAILERARTIVPVIGDRVIRHYLESLLEEIEG